jgi:predicted Zn-dependent peptidase
VIRSRRASLLVALATMLGVAPCAAGADVPRYPPAVLSEVSAVKVIAQADDDALISGVQLFIAAGLDRQPSAKSGVAALTAECIEATPVDRGVPLRDAAEARGGSISYALDGQFIHYYVEGRPERIPEILGLLARALGQPDLRPAAVESARKTLLVRIADAERNPLSVGLAMFRQSFYTGSNAGLPPLGTSASVSALTADDVRAFVAQAYRRGGATVTAVGKLTPAIDGAIRGLVAALPAGASSAAAGRARSPLANPTRIVTHRDIGVPWVVVGFAAPSPGTPDFAAMLLIESLLSTGLDHTSATTLSAARRAIGALYLYDTRPASFVIFVNGGGVEPSLALREVLMVARALANRPLAAEALKRLKATAEGTFVTDALTLADRSYLIGNFASQGLGADYANAALDALDRVTSQDLQRVASRYLQKYTVALVLPREAPPGVPQQSR